MTWHTRVFGGLLSRSWEGKRAGLGGTCGFNETYDEADN